MWYFSSLYYHCTDELLRKDDPIVTTSMEINEKVLLQYYDIIHVPLLSVVLTLSFPADRNVQTDEAGDG